MEVQNDWIKRVSSTARRVAGSKAMPVLYRQLPTILGGAKPSQTRVADIGAGYGDGSRLLAGLGYRVKSFDVYPRFPECQNMSYLSMYDAFFDAVVLSNVINVQESVEEVLSLLRDAARVVKRNGVLVLNLPVSPWKVDVSRSKLIPLIMSQAKEFKCRLVVVTSKKTLKNCQIDDSL